MEEIWLSNISCINLRISFRENFWGPNRDQGFVNMFSCQKKKIPGIVQNICFNYFLFFKKKIPGIVQNVCFDYFLITENDVLGP